MTGASSGFLKATSMECFLLSVAYCFDGCFDGSGKTQLVMIRGTSAALLVRIPHAYFSSMREGVTLFGMGLSTAYAVLFILVFCRVEYGVRKHRGRKAR